MNINVEFFNIIRERLFLAMSYFWFNVDYVKCIYVLGEFFVGYDVFVFYLCEYIVLILFRCFFYLLIV